jgi:hypothetical protein
VLPASLRQERQGDEAEHVVPNFGEHAALPKMLVQFLYSRRPLAEQPIKFELAINLTAAKPLA